MTLTLYMAPNGHDNSTGRWRTWPLRTLDGVQAALDKAQPDTDVIVRIAPGVYEQPQTVAWRYYVPGHSISFAPEGYTLGSGGWSDRPVFTGSGHSGFWMEAHPDRSTGRGGRLHFWYLDVREYGRGGFRAHGGLRVNRWPNLRVPTGPGVNDNFMFGCDFRRIGSAYAREYAWSAVNLVNSSKNTVRNCRFIDLVNEPPHRAYVHGVYAAHYSCNNVVNNCVFTNVSGDPVKVRDASDFNEFSNNRFTKSGNLAYFADSFRDVDYVHRNPTSHLERPSQGNRMVGNRLFSGYRQDELPVAYLGTPKCFEGNPNDYKGVHADRHMNMARLQESDNQR